MSLDLTKLQDVADKIKAAAASTVAPPADSGDQAAVDAIVSELEQVLADYAPSSTPGTPAPANPAVPSTSGVDTGAAWTPPPGA